jgi:putative transposase
MAKVLRREGKDVGRKRVQRLMRTMGVEPIYPRKKLTQPGPNHRIYPYLLRNLTISECDHVWCTDITYIPMKRGFLYLVAIMDWHSRKVLAWRLSNTLDTRFCLEALEEAIEQTGRKPRIFNTDQGCQFTSKEWTERIVELEISISMDGKGAWLDNVIVERFWRTLKYEEVYLKAYTDAHDAGQQLGAFIERYNTWRPHSAHGAHRCLRRSTHMQPERAPRRKRLRGLCPPNPLGFIALGTYRKGDQRKDDDPARAASSPFRISHSVRRSGCVPAKPYPPTKHHNTYKHLVNS